MQLDKCFQSIMVWTICAIQGVPATVQKRYIAYADGVIKDWSYSCTLTEFTSISKKILAIDRAFSQHEVKVKRTTPTL